jgi:hypothetical protein
MKRFNQTKAEQIVKDICDKHITEFGNVVYSTSGFLPQVNGLKLGNKWYQQLLNKIYLELGNEFDPYSKTYNRFINSLSVFINRTDIKVGTVRFDINNEPTYTEPENIKPTITIEYIKL